MSSSDNNITFKKTSFLSGINSEFINQFYSDYLTDPSSLPESWKRFFDGLSEDEKLILGDLNGPSLPEKKIKKINFYKTFEEFCFQKSKNQIRLNKLQKTLSEL